MSAACHLLDAGHKVTLVEKRPYLGGRAFSFTDRETGQMVDNGQHVFLGCCDYYIDFLKKLSTFQNAYLQSKLSIKVSTPGAKSSRLWSAPLPSPFHLLPSFLGYRHLSLKEKLLAIYALAVIRFTNRYRTRLGEQTFSDWLSSHSQSPRAIENLWNLIVKPCVNDDVKCTSAFMGLMIFQEGIMKSRRSACVGYARVGLSALMADAAQSYIQSRHGRLIMGKSATALNIRNGKVESLELSDGTSIHGDFFISALPADALSTLLASEVKAQPYFEALSKFQTAPIVNVHLWYDRPVMTEDFVALVESPLQWVFNLDAIQGGDGSGGKRVSISLSGAFEYIDQPKEALQKTFVEAMAQAFPAARQAKIERVLIVKQDKATFRCLPGIEKLRPKAKSPIRNLFLAGEWTDTGWPSTMEGAVRSGVKAAEAIQTLLHE